MSLGFALIIIVAVLMFARASSKTRVLVAKVVGGLVCLAVFGVLIIISIDDRNTKKRQAWAWAHYTGYRVVRSDYFTQTDVEIGLWTDKKTGKQCSDKGYPGYDACPPQEYVVNGVRAPEPPQFPLPPGATADIPGLPNGAVAPKHKPAKEE